MSTFGSQTIAKSKCLEVFFLKIHFKKLVVKVTKSTTSKPLTKRLKSGKIRINFLIKVAAHKNTRSIRESHLNLHLQRAKDSSSQRTDQRGQENFSALVKTCKAKVLRLHHSSPARPPRLTSKNSRRSTKSPSLSSASSSPWCSKNAPA